MIQQASWIIWNRLNQNLDSERVETRKTISLLAMSRCVEKNKEVVKYYNVRFITESHPWPHDQVLKLILTILVQYRTFLLIIVSKLRRTSNVCTWPLTWRHFPIWVFKSGQWNRSCKHFNNKRLQENLISDSWLWFTLSWKWLSW